MTAGSADLLAELRKRGVTDVDDSTLARALYSSDASLYRVVPQVVVRPRHTDELLAILDVSRSTGVPVTMRGAGTSIAGNAVGPGIVVDTVRHLGEVRLHRPRGPHRRRPAGRRARRPAAGRGAARAPVRPDPSTHPRCTIGGMIGNNACGSRALGYGRTVDNVEALRVAFGTGEVWPGAARRSRRRARRRSPTSTSAHIRTEFGRFTRQVSGYSLEHLLPEHGRRLDRFLVGSEGTLGVVLEATVRLVADEPHRLLRRARLPDDARGGRRRPGAARGRRRSAGRLRGAGRPDRRPGAGRGGARCPKLPRGRRLAVRRGRRRRPGRAARPRRPAGRRLGRARPPARRRTSAEAAALWRIREDGAGLAARSLETPAYSGWEDAAVPPERLGAWLRDFDELLREHGLDGVPYGHFGDGCVHVRIDFPFEPGSDSARRSSATSSPRARSSCATTAARCPASTATAGPAPSCCR